MNATENGDRLSWFSEQLDHESCPTRPNPLTARQRRTTLCT